MNGFRWIATIVAATFVAAGFAFAAEVKCTTISIPKMHCAGCAKKVVEQLQLVPGVEKVEADLKAKTIKVTPRTSPVPSPKAMWEAVEKGDQDPVKIEGPGGTFTSKPKA